MRRYLLDTNAFFEMLSYLAGKNVRADIYDFHDVRKGKCYISKITELEIISVIGKYGRAEPEQWQTCGRVISEDDPMYVVTSDKPLRAAMKAERMEFIVPGSCVN